MASPLPVVQFEARDGILDLGWGHPHPATLPARPWLAATETVLTGSGWQAMTYGYGAGPGPLREWLAERVSRTEGRPCEPSTVFIAAGASHALDTIATLLTSPADVAIVDSPTYHLALRILTDAGLNLVPAPTDEEGIDVAALGRLVKSIRSAGATVELVYLVPTFGNPTGTSLPDARRHALVELADRLRLTLVEDDTYREFAYDGTAPPSLWSIAESDQVIRIGSFSKTVAPGLRLGWLNATKPVVAALARRGYVDSGGGVNHLVAMTMAEFGSSGAYDHHLSVVLNRYARQRDALVEALGAHMPDLRVAVPAGGWFAWVGLPEGLSARRLLPAAEAHGMSYLDGSRFYVDGRGDDHIRLAFSMLDSDDLTEAARRLAAATP